MKVNSISFFNAQSGTTTDFLQGVVGDDITVTMVVEDDRASGGGAVAQNAIVEVSRIGDDLNVFFQSFPEPATLNGTVIGSQTFNYILNLGASVTYPDFFAGQPDTFEITFDTITINGDVIVVGETSGLQTIVSPDNRTFVVQVERNAGTQNDPYAGFRYYATLRTNSQDPYAFGDYDIEDFRMYDTGTQTGYSIKSTSGTFNVTNVKSGLNGLIPPSITTVGLISTITHQFKMPLFQGLSDFDGTNYVVPFYYQGFESVRYVYKVEALGTNNAVIDSTGYAPQVFKKGNVGFFDEANNGDNSFDFISIDPPLTANFNAPSEYTVQLTGTPSEAFLMVHKVLDEYSDLESVEKQIGIVLAPVDAIASNSVSFTLDLAGLGFSPADFLSISLKTIANGVTENIYLGNVEVTNQAVSGGITLVPANTSITSDFAIANHWMPDITAAFNHHHGFVEDIAVAEWKLKIGQVNTVTTEQGVFSVSRIDNDFLVTFESYTQQGASANFTLVGAGGSQIFDLAETTSISFTDYFLLGDNYTITVNTITRDGNTYSVGYSTGSQTIISPDQNLFNFTVRESGTARANVNPKLIIIGVRGDNSPTLEQFSFNPTTQLIARNFNTSQSYRKNISVNRNNQDEISIKYPYQIWRDWVTYGDLRVFCTVVYDKDGSVFTDSFESAAMINGQYDVTLNESNQPQVLRSRFSIYDQSNNLIASLPQGQIVTLEFEFTDNNLNDLQAEQPDLVGYIGINKRGANQNTYQYTHTEYDPQGGNGFIGRASITKIAVNKALVRAQLDVNAAFNKFNSRDLEISARIDRKEEFVPPTYDLFISPNPVGEGELVTGNVVTSYVDNGTILRWEIDFASNPIAGQDVNPSGDFDRLSGNVTINNNSGTFTFNTICDFLTEGDEKFDIVLYNGSTEVARYANLLVLDTCVEPNPSYTLVVNPNPADEGVPVTGTLITSDVEDGTEFEWIVTTPTTLETGQISQTPQDDIDVVAGTFTVTNGQGQFNFNTICDNITEGTEAYDIIILRDGQEVARQVNWKILDTCIEDNVDEPVPVDANVSGYRAYNIVDNGNFILAPYNSSSLYPVVINKDTGDVSYVSLGSNYTALNSGGDYVVGGDSNSKFSEVFKHPTQPNAFIFAPASANTYHIVDLSAPVNPSGTNPTLGSFAGQANSLNHTPKLRDLGVTTANGAGTGLAFNRDAGVLNPDNTIDGLCGVFEDTPNRPRYINFNVANNTISTLVTQQNTDNYVFAIDKETLSNGLTLVLDNTSARFGSVKKVNKPINGNNNFTTIDPLGNVFPAANNQNGAEVISDEFTYNGKQYVLTTPYFNNARGSTNVNTKAGSQFILYNITDDTLIEKRIQLYDTEYSYPVVVPAGTNVNGVIRTAPLVALAPQRGVDWVIVDIEQFINDVNYIREILPVSYTDGNGGIVGTQPVLFRQDFLSCKYVDGLLVCPPRDFGVEYAVLQFENLIVKTVPIAGISGTSNLYLNTAQNQFGDILFIPTNAQKAVIFKSSSYQFVN